MGAGELKTGDVFYSRAGGDFAGHMFYVQKVADCGGRPGYRCKDSAGYSDWYKLEELDPDPASVRPYDADRDPDFIGLCAG
jgi:hypothetical protein